MPKKSILISSGSTKRWEAPSNRFTYDTDTQYVSIDNISSSQFVLTGAANAVLISSGGIITSYKAEAYDGSYLATDGTKWIVGAASNASIGPASGDLTGSYPNPTFKNIANVTTGFLPVARGGFSGSNYNLLSSIPSGSLILASGTGSLTVVSTASYEAAGGANGGDWILGSLSGSSLWTAVTGSAPARDVNVQFFTCSSPTTTTTGSWIKQNPNHKWARVMLQAGGGGGGGLFSTSSYPAGTFISTGGGGGGFTDITVYVGHISSANITVGRGSTGAVILNTSASTAGSSSFSASNIFISALGGTGGVQSNSAATVGIGGIGLTYNGGDGGGFLSAPTATPTPAPASLGAAGGGGSRTTYTPGGLASQYNNSTGASTSAGAPGRYRQLYGYDIPVGFGSGGTGGAIPDLIGGSGSYGAGGGGSVGLATEWGNRGGHGGGGFVVVVSY